MAFAVNMDAWRLGNQDYWKTQAQENWAIENARAEAEAARRQQLFQDDQADRQRRFASAETYGSGLTAPTTVEGAVPRMLQNVGTGEGLGPEFAQYERGYQAPAVAQNPAVSNAVEGPTAVTNNVTTGTGMKNPQVAAFVQKYGPMAEAAAKRLGVSPDVVLGQWGLETGWGQKVIPGTNNIGNIKNPKGVGVRATDNATGSRDAYTVYATPEEGAAGYANLIAGNKNWAGALNVGDNSRAFFSGLLPGKDGGYAEDLDYVRKGVAATDMVRSARGVAPSGVQSQALSRRNATAPGMAALPVEEPQTQSVAQVQAGPQLGLRSQTANDEMGPRQPAEQRQMTVREDPRLAQIKLIGQEAMRRGDTATAAKMAEAYHGIRLESEMGAISSAVLSLPPEQRNALTDRVFGDMNTGLRGALLESKPDPNTGLTTLRVGDKRIQVSQMDLAKVVGGLYAIEKGASDVGYKRIAEVDKSLADLAAQQNDLTAKVVNSGNDVAYKRGVLDHYARQDRNAEARLPKTAPQALTEKFNNLALQLEDPNLDDKARSQIYGQMRVVQTQIANATGERVNMSGLSDPKPQSLGLRAKAEQDWSKIEGKLYENAVTEKDLAALEVKREAFMASRGIAPSGITAALQQGVNPKTGRPLTMQDVEDFNRSYPLSKVDPNKLPWLQKELERQARINQIPR